jgi:hypothetical protein
MPKPNRHIEKNDKLLNRPRTCRIVTKADLEDKEFMKEYPKADTSWIGCEVPDKKPLFWNLGLKRRPKIQQQHAQIAQQFGQELFSIDEEETLFADDEDFDKEPFTAHEFQAQVHGDLSNIQPVELEDVPSPTTKNADAVERAPNAGETESAPAKQE